MYKASAFEDRVNYAASCIVKGSIGGRHFDTCFEMNDGDYVVAALVRRSLNTPTSKLAEKLFSVVDRDRAMKSYEATKHLTRKQLRDTAIATVLDNANELDIRICESKPFNAAPEHGGKQMARKWTTEMPARALEKLMDGYRKGDPALLGLLKEFHILAIMPWDEQDLSRWENEGGQ